MAAFFVCSCYTLVRLASLKHNMSTNYVPCNLLLSGSFPPTRQTYVHNLYTVLLIVLEKVCSETADLPSLTLPPKESLVTAAVCYTDQV